MLLNYPLFFLTILFHLPIIPEIIPGVICQREQVIHLELKILCKQAENILFNNQDTLIEQPYYTRVIRVCDCAIRASLFYMLAMLKHAPL